MLHSQVPFFGMNAAFLNPLSPPCIFPECEELFLLCFPLALLPISPPILHFHNSDSTSPSPAGSVGDRPTDRTGNKLLNAAPAPVRRNDVSGATQRGTQRIDGRHGNIGRNCERRTKRGRRGKAAAAAHLLMQVSS